MQVIVFLGKFRETGSHQLSPTDIAVIFHPHAPSNLYSRVASVIHKRPIARDAEYRMSSVI
jgi:hypothetical protein